MSAKLDILPNPDRFAVVIIDIQERLAAVMPQDEMNVVIRNSVILMETAKEFGMPVIVSEQYPKGLGSSMIPICAALPEGCQPVSKVVFSCCREPALKSAFDRYADYDLILCGIEAHMCVLQTALDLLLQGRRVFVAADGVCSRYLYNRQLALDLLRQAGAVVGSAEIFAFGVLGTAGTERFKRISKLVR